MLEQMLLQMLELTIVGSHSHVGSQALNEVRYCLRDSFSQMVCRATFNSSVVLGFGWNLLLFFSMAPQM